MKKILLLVTSLALSGLALAEAKAKAEEAKAKAAHTTKVEAYALCKSQDKVAAHVQKTNKAKAGKPVATPACADPGPFVYTPPAPAAAVAAAPAAPAAAASPGAAAKK